jgi:hypothetical protein
MKLSKNIIIVLFLWLICFDVFAQDYKEKNHHLISSQETIIKNAFIYLNKVWATQGEALSRKETEKYFDLNTTLIINGRTVYTGYDQFDTHFREVGKHIIGKIRFPFIEVINTDNKLIVRFDEDIHNINGVSYPANVIAIFTLHKGRIKTWEEVAFTKYFCQTGSATAVYSK